MVIGKAQLTLVVMVRWSCRHTLIQLVCRDAGNERKKYIGRRRLNHALLTTQQSSMREQNVNRLVGKEESLSTLESFQNLISYYLWHDGGVLNNHLVMRHDESKESSKSRAYRLSSHTSTRQYIVVSKTLQLVAKLLLNAETSEPG